MTESTGTGTSSGNGAAHPKGNKKPLKRAFDEATKARYVDQVRAGKSVAVVAASIPVVDSVLRGWMKRAGVRTHNQRTIAKAAKRKKPSVTSWRFDEATKRVAAQRMLDGEAVSAIAASMKTTRQSVRDWAKKFPTGTTKARAKGERQALTAAMLPAIAIRDAITYLKHVKTDMYALLQSGAIKEFEEYHLNTLAALRRLQSVA